MAGLYAVGILLPTVFTLGEHSRAWRIVPATADVPAVETDGPSLVRRTDPH